MAEFRKLEKDIYSFLQPPLICYSSARVIIGDRDVIVVDHLKTIEALEADIYVAGHGEPGTLAAVRAQRTQLESRFQYARSCFERGMSYDAALQAVAEDGVPLDFQRLIILGSYGEFTGQRPETTDPASQNHMTLLQGIAMAAKNERSHHELCQHGIGWCCSFHRVYCEKIRGGAAPGTLAPRLRRIDTEVLPWLKKRSSRCRRRAAPSGGSAAHCGPGGSIRNS